MNLLVGLTHWLTSSVNLVIGLTHWLTSSVNLLIELTSLSSSSHVESCVFADFFLGLLGLPLLACSILHNNYCQQSIHVKSIDLKKRKQNHNLQRVIVNNIKTKSSETWSKTEIMFWQRKLVQKLVFCALRCPRVLNVYTDFIYMLYICLYIL